MTSSPPIRVRGLGIRLDGAAVLDDVTFDVAASSLLTVVGPNGAGKSTLLRCLDGLIPPQFGSIEINGTPLAKLDRRSLARAISYVPQTDPAELEFTVRAFVEMGRYPHVGAWEALRPEDVTAVDHALETTEVAHLGSRALSALSGGERQRTLIAAALAQGGRILLLDEPTSFLDVRHQVQVLELLERLHREHGYTVVAVTHDLNATVASSSSVLALKEGRVAFTGSPNELFSCDTLTAVFDTDFVLVPGGRRGLPIVVPARNAPTQPGGKNGGLT